MQFTEKTVISIMQPWLSKLEAFTNSAGIALQSQENIAGVTDSLCECNNCNLAVSNLTDKVCSVNFEPPAESPLMNTIPAQLWLFLVKIRSSCHDLLHNAYPKLPKG